MSPPNQTDEVWYWSQSIKENTHMTKDLLNEIFDLDDLGVTYDYRYYSEYEKYSEHGIKFISEITNEDKIEFDCLYYSNYSEHRTKFNMSVYYNGFVKIKTNIHDLRADKIRSLKLMSRAIMSVLLKKHNCPLSINSPIFKSKDDSVDTLIENLSKKWVDGITNKQYIFNRMKMSDPTSIDQDIIDLKKDVDDYSTFLSSMKRYITDHREYLHLEQLLTEKITVCNNIKNQINADANIKLSVQSSVQSRDNMSKNIFYMVVAAAITLISAGIGILGQYMSDILTIIIGTICIIAAFAIIACAYYNLKKSQ